MYLTYLFYVHVKLKTTKHEVSTKRNKTTYVFVFCLCEVYRPTREFFIHIETSPLPVKGCKFGPMLGTHGH